jgi:periplasmic protein TonB
MSVTGANPNLKAQKSTGLTRTLEATAGLRVGILQSFFSNLKDFLTERPLKMRGGSEDPFHEIHFGAGVGDNLKEWFTRTPVGTRKNPHSPMLVDVLPWYASFWRNVRDTVAPPKLPPLNVSSKPIPVPEIWSKNPQARQIKAVSVAVHVALGILIVVPLFHAIVAPGTTQAKNQFLITPLDISPYVAKLPPGSKKAGGGGGGGEHNPIPQSRGKLPKFSWTQFTPPAVKPPLNPKLAMTPTVLGPPDLKLPSPNMANWGDPLAKSITDSGGPGGGGGIGTGNGGGVGSGNGGGVGPGEGYGAGGGFPQAGANGFGEPACIYCPNPSFSDDAVKTKQSGTVLLRIVVNADGHTSNIQVVRGLGMGLDEKAVETVRGWRLKPAIGPNGRATAVSTLVEVVYRLL